MNAKIVKAEVVKHLPQIFSGLAMIGLGMTAVLSGKNAIKAHYILNETRATKAEKLDEAEVELTAGETVKATWKCYIPTAVAMGLTATCMILSDRMSAAQVASMTTACGYLAAKSSAFEKEAAKELGEEKVEEMKQKAIISSAPEPFYAENYGKGDQLCYEAYSGRLFWSTVEDVDCALKDFSAYWKAEVEEARESKGKRYGCTSAYFSMNDFYDYLGIRESYFGNEFGWCVETDENACGPGAPEEIDFYTYHSDKFKDINDDVYVIEFAGPSYSPYECWLEY